MIKENGAEVMTPENNIIIADDLKCSDCTIDFRGSGNILYAEPGVDLADSTIVFFGDNALLYLSENKRHQYKLKLDLWRETTVYFGKNSYFNGFFSAIASERQNLIVGENGVFSFGIWLRTADPHLIYDISTGKRTNMSKSIMIGDHVWIGQNALILKGSRIGSGSIIAAAAVLAGKEVPSNSVFAGNPARLVKDKVFFVGRSVHNYTQKKTERSMNSDVKDFIYKEPAKRFDFEGINKALTSASDAGKRLDIVREKIAERSDKDRFHIGTGVDHKRSHLFFGKRG
ncbi:MAG: hypothetical protein IJJ06_09400 [Mogibacterium sp.]|nr:hypothetical protein [Mogibacterium sp.]